MKNLYEAGTVKQVQERIGHLKVDNPPLWGSMNPAQAMAHCSIAMEWALGNVRPPRLFLGRIVGGIIKSKVVGDDAPMRRNSPTAKTLIVADQRDLAKEQERLRGLIDRFASAGPAACTKHPHSFFGPLTPEQWAILMYKHLDHHLRQFGV